MHMAFRGGGKAFFFSHRGNGENVWGFISFHLLKSRSACGHMKFSFHTTVMMAGLKVGKRHYRQVKAVLFEPVTAPSPNVFAHALKISPDNANDTANESVKLFSWCFSGVKCQHVS